MESAIILSNNINNLSLKYHDTKLLELANPILTLIYLYPNKDWDLYDLLRKHIIPIDFIKLTYTKISWSRSHIHMTKGITINYLIRLIPDVIVRDQISKNSSIKVSDMLKYDYLRWDYGAASGNTSIRIEDVRDNLDKNWIHNENTTYNDIIKYSYCGNIRHIVKLIELDEKLVQEYIDMGLITNAMNIHQSSLTPNLIRNNPNINWDHVHVDYSKFTLKDIMDIPVTDKYSFDNLCNHPDFTIEYFIDNFDELFDLSRSHNITFDIVLEYKDIIPWNHWGLSENPNVTVDILEDSNFSWIKWDYFELSRYTQLNWKYITKHNDRKWDYKYLSMNKSLIN